MTEIKLPELDDYDYKFSNEKIAKFPVEPRDSSKILIGNNENLQFDYFYNIINYLPENGLLILNNTKVVPARIMVKKETGAWIEFLLMEPVNADSIAQALQDIGMSKWKCMIGNAKKLRNSPHLSYYFTKNNQNIYIQIDVEWLENNENIVTFKWQPEGFSLSEILELIGEMPIPHYIKRKPVEDDKIFYQPVFAKVDGSIASPTASLHFTDRVFEKFENKGYQKIFVTLHVGAGTFKPVKTSIEEHQMHREEFLVNKSTIDVLYENINRPWVVVGTTTLRCLESLLLFAENLYPYPININQFDIMHRKYNKICDRKILIEKLKKFLENKNFDNLYGHTSLFILPPATVLSADYLITNFHQPKSTLLMLVDAFSSISWRNIYDYALENDFRLFSYGDACLLKNKLLDK
ncbi:MAG: S-adenosylmethionine:tRNA ribosyltransferase-isomerase [Bacteroidales bacterium]|jgi:S-adenosylmethionine:tRNA ribosyltransferase-isomerase|nr:S-adenosylmethionine:tRNA ribosyltransferase-isomerase [Bacteroidota bacterium]HHW58676.1 S-adenosylmethionine:tRNA ribosyltransferase-isomerase [Bacteroidales bacterium]HOB77084.1 S-adenosylmethionine:tRNA ribosyltransferase-isomerase [Bacteroidales bacterium]HPZ60379.1 S-adenosylmethionine:tRNA ribosyltransferase-isomerase [Bacteroidales bacterium]HQD57987.1 S-adenosylmethionine:tRNA ribosyltransferase-isomerase [Bacteroidales bacterium]